MTRVFRVLLALILVALDGGPAASHPLAPAIVRLTKVAERYNGSDFTVEIAAPRARGLPRWQTSCVVTSSAPRIDDDRLVVVEHWTCPDGASLRLVADPSDVPVLVERNGVLSALDAAQPNLSLSVETPLGDLGHWLVLGCSHLVSGVDHVLVVFGFIALLGFGRRLIWALTAFTVGHSASLAFAVVAGLDLPQSIVELAIASTLVVIGLELVTSGQRSTQLTAKNPRPLWLGGIVIGLVHGLGFAGALTPFADGANSSGAVGAALVGFNLGLELAQLGLVVLAFVVLRSLRSKVSGRHAIVGTGWVVGIAGACLVVARL